MTRADRLPYHLYGDPWAPVIDFRRNVRLVASDRAARGSALLRAWAALAHTIHRFLNTVLQGGATCWRHFEKATNGQVAEVDDSSRQATVPLVRGPMGSSDRLPATCAFGDLRMCRPRVGPPPRLGRLGTHQPLVLLYTS
jgi:hypothetical protein